eukprot:TRINITY_DN6164_c0_g1_i3.p1 TRINITY_DN6164_c0_g1~~TRINITY_DN6164_c0_g1_i3.p1  ORF type:complete len:293 (+),score=51.49 TRINITY_DN6164_c0_g1_i3:28-879(+)
MAAKRRRNRIQHESDVVHAFRTDRDDHCETPFKAYKDIAPILAHIAAALGTTCAKLRIYDPYFCAGSMRDHLRRLGFETVYNENVDFYQAMRDGTIPDYDVLVTNPPYSTDPMNHIKRLMKYVTSSGKPYLILQPVYVYVKQFYITALETNPGVNPFYLTPSMRYVYETPRGLRNVKPNLLKTAPFVSLWYGGGWQLVDGIMKWWCERGKDECKGCHLKRKTQNMPNKYKDSNDASRRRLRKKQRVAHQHRRQAKNRSNRGKGLLAGSELILRNTGRRTFKKR